jgi:small-conductance mechanosensitive channel
MVAGEAMSMNSTDPPEPEQHEHLGLGSIPEAWREAAELTGGALRRARAETLLFIALFVAVIIVYDNRAAVLGIKRKRVGVVPHVHFESTTATTTAQVVTVILLIGLGWAIARELARVLGPTLNGHLDTATAGTVGFLLRLATLLVTVIVALRFAGVNTAAIAIGASFTAVVFGLAAQQTLGNLIAGTVLLSVRPFRVGDRVRLQGGPLAGQIEGTATSLGLLYTTFATGEDQMLIPNSVVLNVSVTPLREPSAVSMRARLRPGTTPLALQKVLEEALTVPVRSRPAITLEELDGPSVIVKISATPVNRGDGAKLAGELLQIVSPYVRDAAQPTT